MDTDIVSSVSMDHRHWPTVAALTAVYQHGLLQAASWMDHEGLLRMPIQKIKESFSDWDILLLLRARVIGCITHASLRDLQAVAHLAAGPSQQWHASCPPQLCSHTCCYFHSSFTSLNHRHHSILPSFPPLQHKVALQTTMCHTVFKPPPNSFTCNTYLLQQVFDLVQDCSFLKHHKY